MSDDDVRGTQRFWDAVAPDWQTQVGTEGDRNRQLNSDPVLWSFAGPVDGLSVLDAGCGTGYLTAKLAAKGAKPIGVDFSPQMVELARAAHPNEDFSGGFDFPPGDRA